MLFIKFSTAIKILEGENHIYFVDRKVVYQRYLESDHNTSHN